MYCDYSGVMGNKILFCFIPVLGTINQPEKLPPTERSARLQSSRPFAAVFCCRALFVCHLNLILIQKSTENSFSLYSNMTLYFLRTIISDGVAPLKTI